MIDSVPLIQNANDAQQINASIIAMKKASRELDEKIVKLNSLNSELDKKIALLDSGLTQEIEDRKEAINSLDVASVGGSGKYISAIRETDGKISATASDLATTVSSGNSQPVTSGGVYNVIDKINYSASARNIDTLYPSENGKSEVFGGNFSGNVPEAMGTAILKTFRVSAINSSEVQIYQEWEAYGTSASSYAPNQYFRFGYFTGSASPTWTDWQKIIRNTDVTNSISNGNPAPIASGAIFSFRRNLFYDTGLLTLIDNQEKTVTLSSSRMYLYINIHAINGQELVILNCFNGNLRQTRITHAYGGSDTVITNSGQNVTFKATGSCRGHLLLLTDYAAT